MRDIDRDKEITMVPITQQSSEKFSRFVLQQHKLQHVYALGLYDSAAHKFISDNPELDFSGFESSCYDYGRVYASDSFFDPIKQRHIVLSWVNETNMEELELEFSSFLGARQGVFGPFGLILILDPPRVGHVFPRHRHMRKRGGGNLFLPRYSSLYDAIHGWMTRRTNGWMDESRDEKASRKTTTMSFTICNINMCYLIFK
jgi:hypothetical protein